MPPMRQYNNQSASGTMFQTKAKQEPIDAVMERCMLLGQRLVAAEQQVKNQASEIAHLKESVKLLTEKLDDFTAPSIVKEAKSSTATRRKTTSKPKSTTAKTTGS